MIFQLNAESAKTVFLNLHEEADEGFDKRSAVWTTKNPQQ